jgi:hypothetical protein
MRYKVASGIAGSAIFAVAVALTMIQHNNQPPLPRDSDVPIDQIITAPTITTPDELASALEKESVILHLDVEWSIQAIQSRPVIAKFKESLERDTRYSGIAFRRIDCSVQEGPVWDALAHWLRTQSADTSLMVTGYGAIVWIRSGKVVDAVHYAALEGDETLAAKTHSAMPCVTHP